MMKWKGENMRYEFEHVLPADIESRSFAIIEEELTRMGRHLKEDEAPVIMRAIHTTADFDYAETLRFTPRACLLGSQALRRGTAVVTDTNMARSGISAAALEALGCRAVCFMDYPRRSLHGKGSTGGTRCGFGGGKCPHGPSADRRPGGTGTASGPGDRSPGGLCQRGGEQNTAVFRLPGL